MLELIPPDERNHILPMNQPIDIMLNDADLVQEAPDTLAQAAGAWLCGASVGPGCRDWPKCDVGFAGDRAFNQTGIQTDALRQGVG